MPTPLKLSEASLTAHFASIGATLGTNVDPNAPTSIAADWSVDPLVAGLVGAGCEYIARNRGPKVPVAPVLLIDSGLWAWVGYREEWGSEPSAGRNRRFSFRSAGLTIHFGYRNIQHKPQMFRAEWAGCANWDGTDDVYQAGNAAHPHWQFDALESLKSDDGANRAADFLSVLKNEEQETEPRDFIPQSVGSEEVNDLISAQDLSRIHFASAAAWWKPAPNDAHAHSPTTPIEIQVWVAKTLEYVVQELARLQRCRSTS